MMKPGVPCSMMKAVIPSCRAPSPTRAIKITKSAFFALLIQIFRPLITQSSPSRTARVFIPAGSPPAPGSEIAIAEVIVPSM
jgi:hypothetical protein